MRVLHFLPNLSIKSGIINVVMNYYRNINSQNMIFDFIWFEEVETDTFEKEIIQLGGNTYKLPSAKNHFAYKKEWYKFCKTHYGKYDIIHIHLPFLNYLFKNAKKDLAVKVIISHAHNTKFGDSTLSCFRNRLLYQFGNKVPDYLFSCSKDAGRQIFSDSFSLDKGYVIKNSINLGNYSFNDKIRNKIREELKINDKFVIGHVGNFTPQKNHSFIIDIFYEYQKTNRNSMLLLIGDGYLKEKIIKRVNDRNIADKVIILKSKCNVNEYMQAFDFFLFPSCFEGLGIVLIEAQASGLQCLISDKVPTEANICDNKVLSLSENSSKWAKEIDLNSQRKLDTIAKLRNSGYDIDLEASKLKNIYSTIIKKKECD